MTRSSVGRTAIVLPVLAVVLLPLFPSLTPGWPSGGLPLVALSLAAAILLHACWKTWKGARLAALLLAGAFPLYALYTGNGASLSSGDNVATRNVPSLLLTKGTLDVSSVPPFRTRSHYSAVRRGSRLLPAFPLGTALLSLPYGAVALAGSAGKVDEALVTRWEKHFSALVTVAAVILFFLAVKRRFGENAALGASAVFGLATPLPTSTSQAMWSFTGETFFLSLTLFFLFTKDEEEGRPAAAGISMGAAFLCRPTAVIAAVLLGLLLLQRSRRDATRYATAALFSIAAVAFWQMLLYGHPLGAYGFLNLSAGGWTPRILGGLLGTLASPSRGLLVHFPYLLLLPAVYVPVRRDDRLRALWLVSLAAVLLACVLAAAYGKWWGGYGLGPRLISEAAPFLALLTLPFWRRTGRPVLFFGFVVAFAVSATTQLLEAYNPRANDWNSVVRVDEHPRVLWSLRDSQLAAAWVPGWQPSPALMRLIPELLGRQDHALWGSIDVPAEAGSVEGPLLVRGWARIAGENLDVDVFLDEEIDRWPDGLRRFPRPDVASALPSLGDCSQAGYEAAFSFRPGDEGRHRITVTFRSGDGRFRRYPVRSFEWRGPDRTGRPAP